MMITDSRRDTHVGTFLSMRSKSLFFITFDKIPRSQGHELKLTSASDKIIAFHEFTLGMALCREQNTPLYMVFPTRDSSRARLRVPTEVFFAAHRPCSSVANFGSTGCSVLADCAASAAAAQLQGRGNSDELVRFGAKVTRRIVDFVRRRKAASAEKGAEPPAKKYATAKNPTLEGYKQLQAERARKQDALRRELERAAAEDVAGAEPPRAPIVVTAPAMATRSSGNPGGAGGAGGAGSALTRAASSLTPWARTSGEATSQLRTLHMSRAKRARQSMDTALGPCSINNRLCPE
jgi:hypothetical protein